MADLTINKIPRATAPTIIADGSINDIGPADISITGDATSSAINLRAQGNEFYLGMFDNGTVNAQAYFGTRDLTPVVAYINNSQVVLELNINGANISGADGISVVPASQPLGLAVTFNYANQHEVNFWNLDPVTTGGFSFNRPISTTGLNSSILGTGIASALTISPTTNIAPGFINGKGVNIQTKYTGSSPGAAAVMNGVTASFDGSGIIAGSFKPPISGMVLSFQNITGDKFGGNSYGLLVGSMSLGVLSTTTVIDAIAVQSINCSSSGSATVSNHGITITLPIGTAAGGGTTTNYGLSINGNGNAAATNNWALYSTSTAPSLLSGPLTVSTLNSSVSASTDVFGSSEALILNSTLNVTGGASANTLHAFRMNLLPTGVVSQSPTGITGLYLGGDYIGISSSGILKPIGHGIHIAPANVTNKLLSLIGLYVGGFTLGVQTVGNSDATGVTVSQMTNNSSGTAIVVNRAIDLAMPQGDATAGGTANNYAIYITGNGHAGATSNWAIWSNSTAPSLFTGNIIQKPSASVTPANNGELMVQATSNTQLTFKLKGSDGVVRSGSITLA